MKKRLGFLALFLGGLAITASASPVTMQFMGPATGATNANGVAVGPYDFLVGGVSMELLCYDLANAISPGQTWTADMVLANASSGLPPLDVRTIIELGMFMGAAPQSAYADIQQAIWHVSTPLLAPLVNAAQSSYYADARALGLGLTSAQLGRWVFYKPTGQNGQGQFGAVPEPGTWLLFTLGFVTVILWRRKMVHG